MQRLLIIFCVIVFGTLITVSLDRLLASDEEYRAVLAKYHHASDTWKSGVSDPMLAIFAQQEAGLRPELCNTTEATDLLVETGELMTRSFEAFFVEYDQPPGAFGIWRGNHYLDRANELLPAAILAVKEVEATCVLSP